MATSTVRFSIQGSPDRHSRNREQGRLGRLCPQYRSRDKFHPHDEKRTDSAYAVRLFRQRTSQRRNWEDAELLAGISDGSLCPPAGSGQSRAGLCRDAQTASVPDPTKRAAKRHWYRRGHSGACLLFTAGHWPADPAIDHALQCSQGAGGTLPCLDCRPVPAGKGRRHSCGTGSDGWTVRYCSPAIGLSDQRVEPQGNAVLCVPFLCCDQPRHTHCAPGRLWHLHGPGHGTLVRHGCHFLYPAPCPPRV